MKIRWQTILVLLLVPALVAGGVLAGTWRADDRLRQVRAAVVNHDEMVEINGQTMPLGRQLAAELVDSDRDQNVTWVLADDAHARAGLATGQYAAVVTIPKEFSASATSFAKPANEAVQATITVETSPVVAISETAVGQSIAYAAVNALNGFLTTEYLKNIYVGFNDMSTQMLELVDGTRQLADGAHQLSAGTDASAEGAHDLAAGLDLASAGGAQLRDGVRASATGSQQLAVGAGALADGADAWVDGARRYADGVGTYAGGVNQLATGLDTYATGVGTYADGVSTYAGGINSVLAPVRTGIETLPEWGGWLTRVDAWVADAPAQATAAVPQLRALIDQARTYLSSVDAMVTQQDAVTAGLADARTRAAAWASDPATCPADLTEDACAAYRAGAAAAGESLQTKLDAVSGSAGELDDAAQQLTGVRDQLLGLLDRAEEAVDQLEGWAGQLQTSYAQLKASIPAGTPLTKADTLALLDQLTDAGNQLTAGGQQLASGADQLASGADQLATNGGQLADGARGLADGSTQLADGIDGVASGTRQLSTGLGQLATGVDAYTGGIDTAADGAGQLADGLDQLASGASQLSDGTRTLADGVAEGQGQIPTYTEAERDRLAPVVAAPVDADGLAGVVRPGLAWASLLLVLALWAGAMATFAAVRPVDRDALLSRDSDVRLLGRTLAPALGIVGAQGVLLTAVGAVVLQLTPAATAALAAVLLVAGAGFALVNHALAAWWGLSGRLVGLAMAVLTVVAVWTSAPGLVDALAPLSPLTPALTAVRAVGTGTSPVIPALTLVGWALVALLGALAAVHRARTVRLTALEV